MVCKSPLKWPDGWPRAQVRKSALFAKKSSAGHGLVNLTPAMALDRLYAELRRLGVKDMDGDVVVSTGMKPNTAGGILADQAAPKDPGAAVYWSVDGKPRNMAIDIYNRTADNIAAIAAVLEYMRGIERHGGSAIQERAFAGFDALPPPTNCWKILGMKPISNLTKTSESRNEIIAAHREKIREAAADHVNGEFRMSEVNAARDEALKSIGERT